jgi:hypothetical protein
MTDDDPTGRKTPPDLPSEWAYLWKGAQLAHAAWPIVRPIHAFVTNWKAVAAGVIFLVWVNRPEIIAALSVLVGGK